MTIRNPTRTAMSLLEVVLAVTLSAMIAMTGLAFARSRGEVSNARACEACRTGLLADIQLYEQEQSRPPSSTLSELRTDEYLGDRLPHCPLYDQSSAGESNYRLRRGEIICGFHPQAN